MRFFKVFFIFIYLIYNSYAWGQEFKKAYTIPHNPSIFDSILIVDSLFTPATGFTLFANNILISNNHILFTNCYIDSTGFDIVSSINDTFSIGYLPAGTYQCTFYSRKDGRTSIFDPIVPCDSLPNRDTFYYTFTVSQYGVGISDLSLTSLTLSPNPATTTLYSSTSLHDLDLSITDITGRICAAPHTDRDIDISALPAGVYCLRLQTREGTSVVRRFVRE